MSVVESIVERVENLSVREQQEVLDFAGFLQNRKELKQKKKRLKSLRGIWKSVEITNEDIDEVRHEMRANFPRDDI